MASDGLLDKSLSTTGQYFEVGSILPEVQTMLELNTNIKMVSAQLGAAAKNTKGFNNQISSMALTSGVAADSLFKVVGAATKYNKILGTDIITSAGRFSDATGIDSSKLGDFTSKMLAMGAITSKTYDEMLVKILQSRETHGLSTEALSGLLEITEKYYITLGKTGDRISDATGRMAEFISRMNSAGIETETATDIIEKMIDPDKMQDNILLMNRLGVSISDMVVGDPTEKIEGMAPKLKALAEEITSQPNRMLANEMAKMYGYTLQEMQKMTQIETNQKVLAEQKALKEYRTEIQTAQIGLKDLVNRTVGGVTLGLNSVAQELYKVVGPKALGATLFIGAGFILKRLREGFRKGALSFKKSVAEGSKEGADYFYDKLSGIKDLGGSKDTAGSFSKMSKVPTRDKFRAKDSMNSDFSKTSDITKLSDNQVIKNYEKSLSEGLISSEERFREYESDLNKHKNIPEKMSGFFSAQEKIVNEAYGEQASWIMRSSMKQREKKMKKYSGAKSRDDMGSQRATAERQVGETYEGVLSKSTKLQSVDEEINKLNSIGKLTSIEQEQLNKLTANKLTIQRSIDSTLKQVTETKIGGKVLGTMFLENERAIGGYQNQLEGMRKSRDEIYRRLNIESASMTIEQKNAMSATLKAMEGDIAKVDGLLKKTQATNQSMGAISKNAEELAGVSNETINRTLKRDSKELIRIEKEAKKTQRTVAKNQALGLGADAGKGARAWASTKTVGDAATSQIARMAGIGGGAMGSLLKIAGPIGGIAVGVGLLSKFAFRSKEAQESMAKLSKAMAPIIETLSSAVGTLISGPIEFIAEGVEKIASWKIFDKKDDEDSKIDVVDDLSNWTRAERITTKDGLVELSVILKDMNKTMGNVANNTGESSEANWETVLQNRRGL